MQAIRGALEEIILLADDTSWSHAARMVKIKGIASQALSDLNDIPMRGKTEEIKLKAGATGGGKAGDPVQKPHTSAPQQAAEKLVGESPTGRYMRDA